MSATDNDETPDLMAALEASISEAKAARRVREAAAQVEKAADAVKDQRTRTLDNGITAMGQWGWQQAERPPKPAKGIVCLDGHSDDTIIVNTIGDIFYDGLDEVYLNEAGGGFVIEHGERACLVRCAYNGSWSFAVDLCPNKLGQDEDDEFLDMLPVSAEVGQGETPYATTIALSVPVGSEVMSAQHYLGDSWVRAARLLP